MLPRMLTPSSGLCTWPLIVSGGFDVRDVENRRARCRSRGSTDRGSRRVPSFPAGQEIDARVRGPAVELVALPHLERGVERHRPAVRVVVVRRGATEVVELGEVLQRGRPGMPLANFISLTEPFGPPSPLAPLSETTMIEGVFALAGLLQVVQQTPDVVVGVGEEPGVDLGHPAEQPLLVVIEGVPRSRVVQRRERLAFWARCRVSGVPIGLSGGSSVSAGTMPSSFCRARVCSLESPRSPCRSVRGTSRSTPSVRGGEHGRRPARSRGRTACRARSPWRP